MTNDHGVMVDSVGTTKYSYDGAGQLLSEDGPFASDTVTNGYSNRLRKSLSLQQPTGFWTNGFTYDAARRLSTVTSPAGASTYTYLAGLPTRLLARLSLPNSAYVTNRYDSVARLLSTKLNNSVNATFDSYAYVYDPANERTNLTRFDGSTVSYSYDKIGQLAIADSSVASEDRGYLYDTAWNLNWLTNNGSASQFVVDNKNELTSAMSVPMLYDSNGNMTGTQAGHVNAYTYDDENRLVDFQDTVLGLETVFTYDGLGRLRVRQEYQNAPSSPLAGDTLLSETHYIYDGWRVIQERNGTNNTPTVSYTRGIDLSGSLEGAGGIGGLLARSDGYSSGNWTSRNYYFADGNGNITYMLDGSQSMVASYRYDPFGNTISSGGTLASANVYRFSSKEIHANSGMYYYGYRFYDPILQRWINGDPLGDYSFFRQIALGKTWAEKQGLRVVATENLFTFTHNKPVNQIDLLGLFGGWGSAGGYGVPGSDVMNQMNNNSSCVGEILDTYRMFLGNSGFDSYPAANNDDKLQHCITSCRLARACGQGLAAALGEAKEMRDALFGEGSDRNDLDANRHGRNGVNCPKKSCEDYCNETRGQYGDLPPLTYPFPSQTWTPGLGGL